MPKEGKIPRFSHAQTAQFTTKGTMKQHLLGKSRKKTLFCLLAALLVYVAAESAVRLYKHNRAKSGFHNFAFSSSEAPLYVLDEATGFCYAPNARLTWGFYDEEDRLQWKSEVRVNNAGQIAPRDASVEKPASVFRIVVLGDSFSANTFHPITWPMALESVLNEDETLKEAMGRSTFEVLNFALDGTGLDQCTRVFESRARRYDPDMVIINFTSNSPYYKFIYRDTVTVESSIAEYTITLASPTLPVTLENEDCLYSKVIVVAPAILEDKKKLGRIKREIHGKMIGRLPWFSLYPEALASALGGRFGLTPRLDFKGDATVTNYATTEEAVSNSLNVLRKLTTQHPSVLILNHPLVQECHDGRPRPVIQEMIAQSGGLEIIAMVEAMPPGAGKEEIDRWYNLPFDQHPSAAGNALYAREVHKKVRDRLMKANQTVSDTSQDKEQK